MREKPISATWGARCLVLAVLLASTVLGYGLSSKLSNDLQTKVGVAAPHATVDVIVRYKHKPGDAQFSKIVNKNGIIKNHLDVETARLSPCRCPCFPSSTVIPMSNTSRPTAPCGRPPVP